MGAHVAAWRDFLPTRCPLPHPSWRTLGWERKNPWFGEEVLPALRAAIAAG
jgi:uracil-DNA glycosylase